MKYLYILAILVSFVLAAPNHIFAASCTGVPGIGNVSLSNCTLTVATLSGADNAQNIEISSANSADIVLNSGASITINTGGTLAVGSLTLNGGTISIASGGAIKPNTPLYVIDSDGDGWANDTTTLYTATQSGRRRLSLMRSVTTVDCGDTNYSIANQCCSSNGSACTSNGSCCSNSCATNADADGYFSAAAGTAGTCQANALPYTDCYDNNANAYPGSSYCGATHRGDGSFDYNCSTTATKCGTTYNYSATSYTWTGYHGTGSCKKKNADCRANSAVLYSPITSSCGQTAATCAGSSLVEAGCGDCGESPDSFYGCTSVSVGVQACQ